VEGGEGCDWRGSKVRLEKGKDGSRHRGACIRGYSSVHRWGYEWSGASTNVIEDNVTSHGLSEGAKATYFGPQEVSCCF
jgi:hypothetical protein